MFAPIRTHHSSIEERKHLTSVLYTINSKYRISWECAERSCSSNLVMEIPLLMPPPPSGVWSPRLLESSVTSRSSHQSRERTITLAGDEGKPPTGDARLPRLDAQDAVVNRSMAVSRAHCEKGRRGPHCVSRAPQAFDVAEVTRLTPFVPPLHNQLLTHIPSPSSSLLLRPKIPSHFLRTLGRFKYVLMRIWQSYGYYLPRCLNGQLS